MAVLALSLADVDRLCRPPDGVDRGMTGVEGSGESTRCREKAISLTVACPAHGCSSQLSSRAVAAADGLVDRVPPSFPVRPHLEAWTLWWLLCCSMVWDGVGTGVSSAGACNTRGGGEESSDVTKWEGRCTRWEEQACVVVGAAMSVAGNIWRAGKGRRDAAAKIGEPEREGKNGQEAPRCPLAAAAHNL
eukprot:356351-Chlamydomonas_euryale.AAC.4